MEYRYLGNSGLRVSVLGFGSWLNQEDAKSYDLTKSVIKKMYDAGVNFYDTAERYGFGASETVMGKVFKELELPREELVVTTKIWKSGEGVNDTFLSRKHIVEGLKGSLKRLQLEYVDVVYCHRPDCGTPLEETCEAMHFAIEQGWAFYWGTSEWPADRITKAVEYCERANLHKPIVEQTMYNLFKRNRIEKEYRWLFQDYNFGSTVFSPLGGGILTGKYNDGNVPEGSRFDQFKHIPHNWNAYMKEDIKADTMGKLQKLGALAQELGYTQSQLALAWVIASRDVNVAILGFSRLEQVDDNLKALELLQKWTPEIEKKVNEIVDNGPEPDMDWRNWKPLPARRAQAVEKQ